MLSLFLGESGGKDGEELKLRELLWSLEALKGSLSTEEIESLKMSLETLKIGFRWFLEDPQISLNSF
jgi:hypothetical protein